MKSEKYSSRSPRNHVEVLEQLIIERTTRRNPTTAAIPPIPILLANLNHWHVTPENRDLGVTLSDPYTLTIPIRTLQEGLRDPQSRRARTLPASKFIDVCHLSIASAYGLVQKKIYKAGQREFILNGESAVISTRTQFLPIIVPPRCAVTDGNLTLAVPCLNKVLHDLVHVLKLDTDAIRTITFTEKSVELGYQSQVAQKAAFHAFKDIGINRPLRITNNASQQEGRCPPYLVEVSLKDFVNNKELQKRNAEFLADYVRTMINKGRGETK